MLVFPISLYLWIFLIFTILFPVKLTVLNNAWKIQHLHTTILNPDVCRGRRLKAEFYLEGLFIECLLLDKESVKLRLR